jgi:hypothetical protein
VVSHKLAELRLSDKTTADRVRRFGVFIPISYFSRERKGEYIDYNMSKAHLI